MNEPVNRTDRIAEHRVELLTSTNWADFEALFDKHNGVRGGCWCTHNRCNSTEYDSMDRDGRRRLQEHFVHDGRGHGLLVYHDRTAIAWCSFGPPSEFPRYDRGRAYSKLEIGPESQPDWRISCLFVDKHRRNEGWSTIALAAAIDHIAQHGGGIVEAFPFDVPGKERPSYTGSVDMYSAHGFETVATVGKDRYLMRHHVEPAS